MSIVQGTLPVGSLDHAITLNVQSSGGSHFETVTDTTPYLHRASPQDVASSMKLKKVVGGTIAWNQRLNTLSATTFASNNASVSYSNGVATATCSSSALYGIYLKPEYRFTVTGHKYYIACRVTASSGANDIYWGIDSNAVRTAITPNTAKDLTTISNASANNKAIIYYQLSGNTNDTITVSNAMAIDLTQMFGSTIADYIYSLEQAHAGDGVAWFKALFPNSYYAYDSGTLMSVQTSEHKMVEFNLFDADTVMVANGWVKQADGSFYLARASTNVNKVYWENKIGYTGQICVTYTYKYDSSQPGARFRFKYTDGTEVSIYTERTTDYKLITAKSTNGKVVHSIVGDYGNGPVQTWMKDLCINISDASKDGTYEPYISHSYPLDSSLTLRGIPKLDSNNELYYDGDTYASDGTVTRRYGVVDLGTLNWTWYSQYKFYSTSGIGRKTGITNLLSSAFVTKAGSWNGADPTENIVWGNGSNNTVYIQTTTSYADASAFKSAMSGVYLVYELATPTTESADAYTQSQRVGATEEFVDGRTVEIPVGNESEYKRLIQED